jgi:hypothetical protein
LEPLFSTSTEDSFSSKRYIFQGSQVQLLVGSLSNNAHDSDNSSGFPSVHHLGIALPKLPDHLVKGHPIHVAVVPLGILLR